LTISDQELLLTGEAQTMIGVTLVEPSDTATTQHLPSEPIPLGLRHRHSSGIRKLEQLIKVDVVPRLVVRRRLEVSAAPVSIPGATEHTEELTKLVLTRSEDVAFDYVELLRSRGSSIEHLYLGLITSVARHLGDLWLADACSFADVTVGLWRLHHVVRNLSPIFQQEAAGRYQKHLALLVPLPGEQHTFGLYLVAEFFRRAGWGVWSMPIPTTDDLIALVRSEWFTLVGVSLSCENRLEELAADIGIIRRVSCNRGIAVMVGGTIFLEHPELVAQVGADLSAADGREAPAKAQGFITSAAAFQYTA
jgi:methanogenic corrinoid protein MtbC1